MSGTILGNVLQPAIMASDIAASALASDRGDIKWASSSKSIGHGSAPGEVGLRASARSVRWRTDRRFRHAIPCGSSQQEREK
jgi:hypothetical protein